MFVFVRDQNKSTVNLTNLSRADQVVIVPTPRQVGMEIVYTFAVKAIRFEKDCEQLTVSSFATKEEAEQFLTDLYLMQFPDDPIVDLPDEANDEAQDGGTPVVDDAATTSVVAPQPSEASA